MPFNFVKRMVCERMDRVKRNERIAAMMHALLSSPNKVIGYSVFCDRFGAAKSTISEDVSLLQEALHKNGLGQLDTVAGAAGGVRFRPMIPRDEAYAYLQDIARTLSVPDRVLPGGYLYLSDMLSNPNIVRKMGVIIAGEYYDAAVDFVLTMETKGIPVALMVADALNVPLIIARRANRVYEGSAVNMTFPTDNGGVETMSLPRRAVQEGQRTLIVDDFIRKGGTARGMAAMMRELRIDVAGMAFVLAQEDPEKRFISDAKALMTFSGDGEARPLVVRPAAWLQPQ